MQNLEKLLIEWPPGFNPNAEAHFSQAEADAKSCGLLTSEKDCARFRAFVKLDAYTYHYAEPARLAAAGAFNQWLYFVDDCYDDHPDFGQNLQLVENLMLRVFDVMCSGNLPSGASGVERFSQLVRSKLSAVAPHGFWGRFLGHVWQYLFQGSLQSMRLWSSGKVLRLDDYVWLRARDSAVFPALDCALIACNVKLPFEVLQLQDVRDAETHAVRHVALLNDIFSFQKEVLEHRYPCNLVYVLQSERQVQQSEAVDVAIELVNQEATKFDEVVRSLRRNPLYDQQLEKYILGMQAWMRGNYDFSLRSHRFRSPTSPFEELRRSRTISLEMPVVSQPISSPS